MTRLVIPGSVLDTHPYIRDLLDPAYTIFSANNSFAIITEDHPHLSTILLYMDNPVWWDDVMIQFKNTIAEIRHQFR